MSELPTSKKYLNPRTRDLPSKITEYLSSGGLFNPELMDHEAVRDMLIHARDVIEVFERERSSVETSEEADPCVSHLALKEWDRMFDAWVKHQAGLPSDVPLWPNPDWSQDIAMVAHALAQPACYVADPNATKAPQVETPVKPLPSVEFMNGYISARTDRSYVLGLLHDWFRHHANARGPDGRLLHPDLDVETQRELLKTESSEKSTCNETESHK